MEKKKDLKKAEQCYKESLVHDENNINSAMHLASILGNGGQNQKAAKYFKHVLKLEPENLQAHYGLGKVLQSGSNNKDATIKEF